MNVDVTLFFEGWHGDHSRMYSLGDVSVKAKRLMDVTYEAMMAASMPCGPAPRSETWLRHSTACRN